MTRSSGATARQFKAFFKHSPETSSETSVGAVGGKQRVEPRRQHDAFASPRLEGRGVAVNIGDDCDTSARDARL